MASEFQSEAEDAEVEIIVARCDGELKRGMTPMKKRAKLAVTSPAFEAGFRNNDDAFKLGFRPRVIVR
jgi:hypothetical protein